MRLCCGVNGTVWCPQRESSASIKQRHLSRGIGCGSRSQLVPSPTGLHTSPWIPQRWNKSASATRPGVVCQEAKHGGIEARHKSPLSSRQTVIIRQWYHILSWKTKGHEKFLFFQHLLWPKKLLFHFCLLLLYI